MCPTHCVNRKWFLQQCALAGLQLCPSKGWSLLQARASGVHWCERGVPRCFRMLYLCWKGQAKIKTFGFTEQIGKEWRCCRRFLLKGPFAVNQEKLVQFWAGLALCDLLVLCQSSLLCDFSAPKSLSAWFCSAGFGIGLCVGSYLVLKPAWSRVQTLSRLLICCGGHPRRLMSFLFPWNEAVSL